MTVSCRGIVIRTFKYSDSSIIAKIFTDRYGLESYLIKGIRGKKSKFRINLFTPLSVLNMEAIHKSSKGLQSLKEISFANHYQNIPFDIVKQSLTMFLAEVLNETLKQTGHPDEEMFEFILDSLNELDKTEKPGDFHIRFLIHLSGKLGFWPSGEFCDETPYFHLGEGYFVAEQDTRAELSLDKNESAYVSFIVNKELEEQKLDKISRKMLLKKLIMYFKLHFEPGFEIQSAEVLESVFE